MTCERLQTAASEFVLGLVGPSALPSAAVAALEDGCDSPCLRVLAGLTPAEHDEAGGLLRRALAELNVSLPSGREAVLRLARETAKRILSGETGPREGAQRIWDVSLRLPDEHLPQFDTFIYAASEWQSRPADREKFADGVKAASRDLLQDGVANSGQT
jgi:hypothetical protein